MGTWNVRSLNKAGGLNNLKDIMEKYKLDILALQEIRWRGNDIMDTKNFSLLYSGHDKNTFGTGFLISKKLKESLIDFQPISERICLIRIRGKLLSETSMRSWAENENMRQQ